MHENAALELSGRLRAYTAAAGIYLVEGDIQSEPTTYIPQVILVPDDAVALMEAVQPPVLYLSELVLDAELQIDGAREELELNESDQLPSTLSLAAKVLERHNGEIGRVIARFVIGSVLHTTMASAHWLTEFEDNFDEVSEDIQEENDRALIARNEETSAQVETLARKLLAEPAFSFGRTSAAKRLTLAKAMFSNEDSSILGRVVAVAEQLDWLAQSGFRARDR